MKRELLNNLPKILQRNGSGILSIVKIEGYRLPQLTNRQLVTDGLIVGIRPNRICFMNQRKPVFCVECVKDIYVDCLDSKTILKVISGFSNRSDMDTTYFFEIFKK